MDGDGRAIGVQPVPNTYDRIGLITDWVEKGIAPGMAVTVTAGDRSLPMCSYPEYPKYQNGPTGAASSYACSARQSSMKSTPGIASGLVCAASLALVTSRCRLDPSRSLP